MENFKEEYQACPGIQERSAGRAPRPSGYGIEDKDCETFLRQVTVFYHYVHYVLDRPFLKDKEWPKYHERLKKELRSALENDRMPTDWIHHLFIRPPESTDEKTRYARYESSLQPLFASTRQKAASVLKSLEKMEISARQFSKSSEENTHYRHELGKIRDWALQKSWEVARILGFANL